MSERAGQYVLVNLRVKNAGKTAWPQGGSNPVHVGYKWFNAAGQQQLDVEDRRTALPTDVAPGAETALGAVLVAPKTPGEYKLRWDLVAEKITWFADAGNPPLIVPVKVTQLPIDVSGWRAEASVNPGQVAHALDGKPDTYWDSATPQAAAQWFRVNLSTPRVIDGIQFLSPGSGFPAGYSLRVSGDGQTWVEITEVHADNTNDVMAIFAPQSIQYVQIDLLTASTSSWKISEILCHSAVEWTARASVNGEAARLAIDNRPDTAWSSVSPQAAGAWFQIDLGRVESVSGIVLDAPASDSPVNFRITVWNASASRWQIVQEVKDNHEAVDCGFPAVLTQFVGVQLTDSGASPWTIQHAHVIREMETWLGPSR
ncbi:MAG: discoidin domain-containing protein [Chloroflexi bacterium]|nr:discoidin domain-containing protein [Chloroflexota bacterium]